MTIIYRTSGPWGAGQGSDLLANQVDSNFYQLAQDIAALQAAGGGASIDYLTVNGNTFFVHLTDHTVLGPYTLPTAQWNFRGPWQPSTNYNANDVFVNNGSVYLVTVQHVSPSGGFGAGYTISGNQVYALLLSEPGDVIPLGGTVGQVLTQGPADSPGNVLWTTLTRNIALFIEGQPTSGETVLQYVCPEEMTLPIGLDDSQAADGTANTANSIYSIFKNGNAIGSIEFSISPPGEVIFSFPAAITFEPGDLLTIVAPSPVDATQANVSITLQALLP